MLKFAKVLLAICALCLLLITVFGALADDAKPPKIVGDIVEKPVKISDKEVKYDKDVLDKYSLFKDLKIKDIYNLNLSYLMTTKEYKENVDFEVQQITYLTTKINTSNVICLNTDKPYKDAKSIQAVQPSVQFPLMNETYTEPNETSQYNNTCYPYLREIDYVNVSAPVNATFKIKNVNKVYFENQEISSEKYQCWVCGNYIGCIDKKDGGSTFEHRASEYLCDANNKPVLRSGESGYIQNIETKEFLQKQNDLK